MCYTWKETKENQQDLEKESDKVSEKKHYHRGRRRSFSSERKYRQPVEQKEETEKDFHSEWEDDWIDLSDADEIDDLSGDDFIEDGDIRTADQVKATGKRKNPSVKNKKRSRRAGRMISNLILVVAVIVFCVSAFQLFRILSGYYEGRKEYDQVRELAIKEEKEDGGEETGFTIDFNALKEINPDTVGWIKFDPEPSQINYPLVQTTDNSTYLNKTFSANENTVGAIFVNTYNHPDFNDRNTIIYGHRMNDNSMFHDLAKYEDRSFWEANPYFYIYTPDGRKLTYHIYAAGQVTETSDTYLTEFADDAAYQAFLDYTKQASSYDTGVEVTTADTVVTLSTCTKASDEHRMVVVGVKENEEQIQ